MQGDPDRLNQIFAREGYCTVRRACEYLNVGIRSFYRWLDEGKISFVHRTPGGHIRIDRTTLLRIEGEVLKGELYGEPYSSDPSELQLSLKFDKKK